VLPNRKNKRVIPHQPIALRLLDIKIVALSMGRRMQSQERIGRVGACVGDRECESEGVGIVFVGVLWGALVKRIKNKRKRKGRKEDVIVPILPKKMGEWRIGRRIEKNIPSTPSTQHKSSTHPAPHPPEAAP